MSDLELQASPWGRMQVRMLTALNEYTAPLNARITALEVAAIEVLNASIDLAMEGQDCWACQFIAGDGHADDCPVDALRRVVSGEDA